MKYSVLPSTSTETGSTNMTMNILDNMHTSHLAWINNKNLPSKATSYLPDKQQAQARLHAMKEAWWSDRASEIQQASDQKDAKCFYDGLKAV